MNSAIVLFSGGIDSSYTVMRSSDKYSHLILVTYRTPGMINLTLAEKTAGRIKKILGNKIEHRVIDIRKSIKKNRGNILDCLKANLKYRFFYSWCLGCKLGMHLYTIELCRQEGISTVLDGSSVNDAHALEQNRECENFFTQLYTVNGINFFSPFYDEPCPANSSSTYMRLLCKTGLYKASTAARAEYLHKAGLATGPALISQYRTTQPSCVISLLFNIPRIFLKTIYKEKKDRYLAYLKELADKNKKK